jgi:hypothetical protein
LNRSPRRRWQRWASLLLVLLGFLLLGIWAGRLFMTLRSFREHLSQAQSLLDKDPATLEPAQVRALLSAMRQEVLTLRGEAGPILWVAPALGWVPGWGGDLAAAPALLEMADDLTGAALLAWEGLEPSIVFVRDGQPDPQGRSPLVVLAGQLTAARPTLAQAQGALRRAMVARERLDPEHLSPSLRDVVDRLDQALPLFDQGLTVAQAAPVLLGVEGERNYLILAQNEDELRATGGFISGYGIVTIRGGQVTGVTFDNSYNADDFSRPYPDAPAAMRRFMGITLWVFRDSNWSPDFPASARQAINLFRPPSPVSVDGVIALDQEALRRLVEAVGPLEVEGQVITGETIVLYIRQAWAPAGGKWTPEEWRQRKEFMGPVAAAILHRLQGETGGVDWISLARVVQDLAQEKHVLLYLPQPQEVADLLAERGWDGSLRPFPQDFLLVVDSNVGYNKVNPRIVEEIVYQADLAAAQPVVTVTLHYTHTGDPVDSPCRPQVYAAPLYEDMMKGCYWDYLRLYVPEGGHLRGGWIPFIPAEEVWNGEAIGTLPTLEPPESGRQVFSAAMVMPPGGTRALSFNYDLPPVLRYEDGQWHYRLLVQKQPGTGGHRLTVALKLPAQAEAVACQPSPCPSVAPLVFHLTLDRDQEVEVVYRTP